MKLATLYLLPTIGILALLPASAEPAAGQSGAATDQIQALKQQVDNAYAAYHTNKDASGKLWNAYFHLNDTNLPKIFELAKQTPDSKISFEAFCWIVTNGRIHMQKLSPYGAEALQYLKDYHSSSTNIGELCRTLGNNWDPMDQKALDFLQAASENNPDHQSRGFATLALGQLLKERTEIFQMFPFLPQMTNKLWLQDNERIQEAMKKTDANALFRQSLQALETVQKDYADCPALPRHSIRKPKATLGEEAATELYELNHLTLGKQAPETDGADVDGSHLKLSQFHGKVLLVTFWASWCGPCMQMVPLERSLA